AGDLQHRRDRVLDDGRDAPGADRPRRHRVAAPVAARRAGAAGDEGGRPGRGGAVRALPLVAVRRVAVVRHDPGPDRAGLVGPVVERRRADRFLRLVPGPPGRARRPGGCVAPPVAGEARSAEGAEAPALTGATTRDRPRRGAEPGPGAVHW